MQQSGESARLLIGACNGVGALAASAIALMVRAPDLRVSRRVNRPPGPDRFKRSHARAQT